MQHKQLDLFEGGANAKPSVREKLETLPPKELLNLLMALGLETHDSLKRMWHDSGYQEEGQTFYRYDSMADMVAANRETYLEMADRVEHGDAASYPEAREAVLQERHDAFHAVLDEMRARYENQVRKPR